MELEILDSITATFHRLNPDSLSSLSLKLRIDGVGYGFLRKPWCPNPDFGLGSPLTVCADSEFCCLNSPALRPSIQIGLPARALFLIVAASVILLGTDLKALI